MPADTSVNLLDLIFQVFITWQVQGRYVLPRMFAGLALRSSKNTNKVARCRTALIVRNSQDTRPCNSDGLFNVCTRKPPQTCRVNPYAHFTTGRVDLEKSGSTLFRNWSLAQATATTADLFATFEGLASGPKDANC